MGEIHELPIRRAVPDCMDELMDVLRRHQSDISNEDACFNILGNLAMVFGGQEPARAAQLLQDTCLSVTAFYGVPVVIARYPDGTGKLVMASPEPSKPE